MQITQKAVHWILLVEDEKDLAEEITNTLEELGYKVVHSTTALDASVKARNQRFSCIVLDVRLEKGTGDQVIHPIRDLQQHVNYRTPILLTSSHLDRELIASVAKKVDGAMVKPYKMSDLVAKIASLIESGRQT